MDALKKRAYEANMELWRKGLVIYTWGNVSELDRQRGVFAIKPSGVPYDELTAWDMVVLDVETGKKIEGKYAPSSDTPTHLALYRAFETIGGVTHTHSSHATAWAQAARAIPCYGTTHADYFYGAIPCTRNLTAEEIESDYEWNTGRLIVETMQGKDPLHMGAALVRHHGPFTWGETGAVSVEKAVVLEEVARMALCTCGLLEEKIEAPVTLQDKHFFRKHGKNAYYGQKK